MYNPAAVVGVFHTAITVGFELESYTFTEATVLQEVCVIVSKGSLGQTLIINVIWTAVTATGIQIKLSNIDTKSKGPCE